MNRETSRNPGAGAWFALNLLAVAAPTLVLVLVSVAGRGRPEQTFGVIVSYSIVLLIAFTLFATTVGALFFQRMWPGPWELVEGIVLGLILLSAIGVTFSRSITSLSANSPDVTRLGIWFTIQVSILLGVLFYCSALRSWTARKFEEEIEQLRAEIYDQDEQLGRLNQQLKEKRENGDHDANGTSPA